MYYSYPLVPDSGGKIILKVENSFFIFSILKEFHIFPFSCLPTSGIILYNIDTHIRLFHNKLVRFTQSSKFLGETSIIKTLQIRNVRTP
jgi:hypothetical protein